MIVEHDIVVIGGGMAGASIAAHLAEHASVRLLEMEPQPGYHSTGRSAAVFFEPYGNESIRALTRASRSFFYSPPSAFCSAALVKPRGILVIARTAQEGALQAFLKSLAPSDQVKILSASDTLELHPLLRAEGLIAGALCQGSADIEVHELHQGYLQLFQSRGGTLTTRAQVVGLEHSAGAWSVTTTGGVLRARIVVNAAGAWAGEVGMLAGALDIGLQPLKRTACLIRQPPGLRADAWPTLVDVGEQFYLKPDAGMLLLSPADETLIGPCDVQADDMDVAIAVDRIETATTLDVKRVTHKWAGLRSFVQDRSPVVGYDPLRPGFYWLAALGGYGIQIAPALSRVAASLVLDMKIDENLLAHGINFRELSPNRLLPNKKEVSTPVERAH